MNEAPRLAMQSAASSMVLNPISLMKANSGMVSSTKGTRMLAKTMPVPRYEETISTYMVAVARILDQCLHRISHRVICTSFFIWGARTMMVFAIGFS